MKWKSIITITLGAALFGASGLAQTTTPSGTGAGAGQTPTTGPTKAPAAALPGTPIPSGDATNPTTLTQPDGTMSDPDTARMPAVGHGNSGKPKTAGHPATKTSPRTKGERVRSVQEALKAKGYDPGPVDGVFGPKSHTALREFQKSENLPESGRPDTQTLARLGVR